LKREKGCEEDKEREFVSGREREKMVKVRKRERE